MIPRLAKESGTQQLYAEFLGDLGKSGFQGEISVDFGSRLVAATDNSVYQVLPQAIVFPRQGSDVSILVQLASKEVYRTITMSPRGGGTGTNGQSLSDGIIVDVSRHMNRILEVCPDERWVRVQPGVVLDELNRELAQYDLFFAPHVAPGNRATIGGMISTDAAGKGSRIYGKTSDHVLELTSVWPGGSVWTSHPMTASEVEDVSKGTDTPAAVHRLLLEIVHERRDLITERFPQLKRFMTGYNLAKLYDHDTGVFNLNYLLAGSEGTLSVLTSAKLNLEPVPKARKLYAIRYERFEDALESATLLLSCEPAAIESIDDKILQLAKGDPIYHRVKGLVEDSDGAQPQAINLVEFQGGSREEVDMLTKVFEDGLRRGALGPTAGYLGTDDSDEMAALWDLRKKGVGLLGRVPGPRKPIPFVEDTVVPPARLEEYVAELRALLEAENLDYGMFGHVDVGCLHVRPALDMTDPEDERRMLRISDQVVQLVQKYGGLIWGEHGKGFRSQYNPMFFGEELFAECCRIKEAFDPFNQLNPGKVAVSPRTTQALARIDASTRGQMDRQIPEATRRAFAPAIECNGNAACLDVAPDRVMCPSSKVRSDRRHSPKGRAAILREWLRRLANQEYRPDAPPPRKAFLRCLGPFRRLWNSVAKAFGRYDYSHEVYASMDGCLACKACATQCPLKVDVPELKARFLEAYHERYRRPRKDRFIASLESLLPLMSRVPRLSNFLTGNPLSRWFLRRWVGIVDVPKLSVPNLRARLRPLEARLLTPRDLHREWGSDTVFLVQDAFTSHYEAHIVADTCALLSALGFQVAVIPFKPNGKGLVVKGYLSRFRKEATRNARHLAAFAGTGVPLVVIDPAIGLTYADEYRKHLPAEKPLNVLSLQQFLAAHAERWSERLNAECEGESYTFFGHCTERSLRPTSDSTWQEVFASFGLKLEPQEVGCCGMCGAFGHERSHLNESKGIYRLSWASPVDHAGSPTRLLVTGHSCRSQVKRLSGIASRHPVEALLARVRRPRS